MDSINLTSLKISQVRGIKARILKKYPGLGPYLEVIVPKKGLKIGKVPAVKGVSIYVVNDSQIIFLEREGELIPALKLLHKYPFLLKKVVVEASATSLLLQGSHFMIPDCKLSSAAGGGDGGGDLRVDFEEGELVGIVPVGKENMLAVGISKMPRDDFRHVVGRACGIENIHHIGDAIWNLNLQNQQ